MFREKYNSLGFTNEMVGTVRGELDSFMIRPKTQHLMGDSLSSVRSTDILHLIDQE